MKISLILKSIVAFFAMISVNVFASAQAAAGSDAVALHLYATATVNADFDDLITSAQVTNSHTHNRAIATGFAAFSGNVSANDNQGFVVSVTATNGVLKHGGADSFPDIDYTLACGNITITADDDVNQISSNQVTTSKFTAQNLGTSATELYRMDGEDGEDAIPLAALDNEPYSCTITPLVTNFDIAHAMEGTYSETWTISIATAE